MMARNPVGLSEAQLQAAREFHIQFFGQYSTENGNVHCRHIGATSWMGTPLMQLPSDLIVIQEIICGLRPDLIVECGTAEGGLTLFMASICELVRHGNIVTIDNEVHHRAPHPFIRYLVGDTVDPKVYKPVHQWAKLCNRVMVILDDDHHRDHVFQELDVYSKMVTKNSYLIVEDTSLNGHPVYDFFGPGPWEAVHDWLPKHPEFVVDDNCEKFAVTNCPEGWLFKVK